MLCGPEINMVARDGNFYFRKTSLGTGFSACNCLFDSRNCLLTSLILGSYYKLNWPKRASAVYWSLGTLLYPCSLGGPLPSPSAALNSLSILSAFLRYSPMRRPALASTGHELLLSDTWLVKVLAASKFQFCDPSLNLPRVPPQLLRDQHYL